MKGKGEKQCNKKEWIRKKQTKNEKWMGKLGENEKGKIAEANMCLFSIEKSLIELNLLLIFWVGQLMPSDWK